MTADFALHDAASAPEQRPHRAIDRFLHPSLTAGALTQLRQARITAVVGLSACVLYAYLALTMFGAETVNGPLPLTPIGATGISLAITAFALVLLRRWGHVAAAAWVTTLTVALTPALQATLDLGLRDPVVHLFSLAPLIAAMVSGVRMAVVNAIVAMLGIGALLGAHLAGVTFPVVSSEPAIVLYSFLAPATTTVLSAVAGIFYVRHSRRVLAEAEAYASTLDTALRQSEARFRSLFTEMPIGLCRSTPDGTIVMANPALARLIGVASVADTLALNTNDLYADPAQRKDFVRRITSQGTIRRFEAEWRRTSGETCTVRIDAHLVRHADGSAAFYEGTIEDITAEQRVRSELRRNEARFRALVQRSSDLTVVLDRTARLTYASPSARTLLGYEPDLMLGTVATDLVHHEERDDLVALFRQAADRRGERTLSGAPFELRIRHADGHYLYLEGAGSILFSDPDVQGLVLNLRDITERKRAQAVLLQAKRQAEEVAHLKSTFIANMSHEIRTPLTAILGFSDLLAEEVTDPEQREFVDLISTSGRRLMDTLNSVLDLARLEAGRDEMALTALSLDISVDEAVTLLRAEAAERGLALDADTAPGVQALLDSAALSRVLHNLIGNALKFTREGGVTVRTFAADGHACIEVADTGIGIDPQFLPRLFGEFEQASTGTERTHEGAGLGLAITRQLVAHMGGTVEVESEVGRGSTFTVRFPLLSTAADAPADDDRPRVLVVDDNEQALLVAERVLEGTYRVEATADAEAALASVARSRPDAVLLDIHLGDALSGEDIMRHLRAQPGNEGLPIVALTAFALPGDRARFLAAGFDAYLTKPYTRDALLETVDAVRTARAPEASAQEAPAMIVRNPEAGRTAPARPRDGAPAEPHTPR